MGSEVSQHVPVNRLEHGVSLDKVKILTVDNMKFERGVKEAIYIRVMEPSVNKMVDAIFFQQCGPTCCGPGARHTPSQDCC